MKRILWWVCLLLAPAVLIGLELFHPANFTAHPGMYQYLSQAEPHSAAHHHALDYFGPRWWLVLHMIQTPSWAAFAASVFIAAALLLPRRAGWANMAVLVAFGWELRTDHAAPHGPIAFALLIVASAWLWFSRTRRAAAAPR